LREDTPLTSIGDPKALTEYLNQMTLKNDMVLDELKRVTADRDGVKTKLDEAEKSAKEAWDEVTNLKKEKREDLADSTKTNGKPQTLSVDTASTAETKHDDSLNSPSGSVASKNASLLGRSIFSPKMKPDTAPAPEESEEFFSFDNEIPRLESEIQEKQHEISQLRTDVENLRRDLAVARESTEGMVGTLESATRELEGLRDAKDKHEIDIKKLESTKQAEIDAIKTMLVSAEVAAANSDEALAEIKVQLQAKADELLRLKDQTTFTDKSAEISELSEKVAKVEMDRENSDKRLGVMQGLVNSLKSQVKDTEGFASSLQREIAAKDATFERLQNLVNFVDEGLKSNAEWQAKRALVEDGKPASFDDIRASLANSQPKPEATKTSKPEVEPETQPSTGGGKKKKNKKKKGGKGGDEPSAARDVAPEAASTMEIQQTSRDSADVGELNKQIQELAEELTKKDAAIENLNSKLKRETESTEALKEERDSLQDDLVNIGQEHVQAKDEVKSLQAEKQALEETLAKLEKEAAELRTGHESSSADSAKLHTDLTIEFEDLKIKSTTLEKDLSAAQQLAASRFRDLTDLRDVLQKIQPELRNLRSESSELKSTKEELKTRTAELKKLETKHDDLRAEVKSVKSIIVNRENEVKTLNQKIRQETDSRLKAEEALSVAKSDLRQAEARKQESVEASDKTSKDLSTAQEELRAARAKLREVEEQVQQFDRDVHGLREEIQLKTAQHASAQSLMSSMRDQTSEMAMQMKEARERCDSLEEELTEAHRLLSERSREGETMRRLLNEIESRTDTKVRDFKERMEAAVEERDRAEEEASTYARRRARELEELKSKVRETEKALKTVENDKEELEYAQRDWKRRRDELEAHYEQSTQEIKEIRSAMAQLRDALDESEKQTRELEKDKAELRRSVEETSNRLEKLRRANKTLTDEVKAGQNSVRKPAGVLESGNQSSRSSIDSPGRRMLSPASHDRNSSTSRSDTPTGSGGASIDYIYLKNVLLQFLEQKDKNYQKQLIPVLGMLLHFDR
jgi:chromosome segregation ATPase